jgi:hypothetical protein
VAHGDARLRDVVDDAVPLGLGKLFHLDEADGMT